MYQILVKKYFLLISYDCYEVRLFVLGKKLCELNNIVKKFMEVWDNVTHRLSIIGLITAALLFVFNWYLYTRRMVLLHNYYFYWIALVKFMRLNNFYHIHKREIKIAL